MARKGEDKTNVGKAVRKRRSQNSRAMKLMDGILGLQNMGHRGLFPESKAKVEREERRRRGSNGRGR